MPQNGHTTTLTPPALWGEKGKENANLSAQAPMFDGNEHVKHKM